MQWNQGENIQMPDRSKGEQKLLTMRQLQCLKLFAERRTAKQIGRALDISHHAVEKHLANARQRLGVSSTQQAADLVFNGREKPDYNWSGLVDVDPVGDSRAVHLLDQTDQDGALLATPEDVAHFTNRITAFQTIAFIVLVALAGPVVLALLMSLAVGTRLLLHL